MCTVQDVAPRRGEGKINNLVRRPDVERGGHFAGMAAPDLLIGGIREFFGELGRRYRTSPRGHRA
ncbi:hypothetical protein [Streptosporangium roseum]|uniref:hypothetical protein n=1 Tax=Streptosporangium roseum TaxID=2001 RepID=UPI003327C712